MTKKSDIPQAVLEKAKEDMEFLKEFDYPHAGELQYLGKRNKVEYYVLHNHMV